MAKTLDLNFEGLAYPGQTFGRDEAGRMIFAPFGLPGEQAQVVITEEHKHWAQAQILEILHPAPQRISPRCCHFMTCGGCHYQHMPYEMQLTVKQDIVRSQLERIGAIQDPKVQSTIPSPSPWHTRNHMQYHLDPQGRLGFRAARSDQVVTIEECYLPDENLSDLWPRLDLDRSAGIERIALRSGSEGSRMIVFYSDKYPQMELALDLTASVVWLAPEEMFVLAGDEYLIMEVLHRPFRVSAGSFFQVHTELAGELVQHSLDAMQPQPNDTVFDLYAGAGLFSAFIALAGAQVIAVEESPWATRDFEMNLDEFEHVALYQATVEETLPSLTIKPESVIVDPPRAGLGRNVVQQLIELCPSRIAYVSCDPATLARDAKRLIEGGYRLDRTIPFDLFPQTYHIETLSLFCM